jgi:hypothetical protein
MIKEGDFVLVDKDAAEFTFEKDYFATVVYVGDEDCQVETLNGTFLDIEDINNVRIVDKTMFKEVISEAQQYCIDKYYSPSLQIVIDIMEEFDELLKHLEGDYDFDVDRKTEIGAMAYNITLLIEVFKYRRESYWSCPDLDILDTLERYARLIKEII